MSASRSRHLDVYHLPSSGLDAQHPIWWGNTLLLCVESTILVLLLVTYFYLRKNFDPWPPPQADPARPPFTRMPGLGWATADLVVLLLSCIPMAWMDRRARARAAAGVAAEERPEPEPRSWGDDRPHTSSRAVIAFSALTLLAGISVFCRFREFPELRFAWHENAYASTIWMLIGTHLSYVIMSLVEVALLAIWTWREGLTLKFALDTTLAASSWYWTVATWAIVYTVVFWVPRWFAT